MVIFTVKVSVFDAAKGPGRHKSVRLSSQVLILQPVRGGSSSTNNGWAPVVWHTGASTTDG